MAARTTMAALITKVRELTSAAIGDYSDLQVQAFLDRHRVEFRYTDLCPIETRAAGSVTYKTFDLEALAPRMIEGNAGDDPDAYQLLDGTYAALTPATEDLINGRWTFTVAPNLPVMIVCWAYDVYAAAVDLLEEWSATTSSESVLKAVEDNGQRFEWATDVQGTAFTALIETYRARMCAQSVHIGDSDHLPW